MIKEKVIKEIVCDNCNTHIPQRFKDLKCEICGGDFCNYHRYKIDKYIKT